jgi:group I intron endonuclease
MIEKCISGIYCIRCLATGRVYVGQSQDIRARCAEHKRKLVRGKSRHLLLQRAWNKYGAEGFTFEVLEVVDIERLTEREDHWIKLLGAFDRDHGLNLCPAAGTTRGYKHTAEAIEKTAAWNRGKKRTPETIAKMSAGISGLKRSDESRARMRAAQHGKSPSLEARAKSASLCRGKKRSPEVCAKISAGRKGKRGTGKTTKGYPVSAEMRARISAKLTGRKLSPEHVAHSVAGMLGHPVSEATRAKLSAAGKGRKLSPESVAKRTATRKRLRAAAKAANQQ